MFDIGFWELSVIAIVALIVIGPDKLPGLARTAGLWIGKARHFLGNVKADIDRELKADELRRALDNNADISELKDILSSTRETVEQEANPDYLVKAMSDDRPEPIDSAQDQADSGGAPLEEQGSDKPEPVKTENQLRAEQETRRIYAKQAEVEQAGHEEPGAEESTGAEESNAQPADDQVSAETPATHESGPESAAVTGDDNKNQ